MWQWAFWLAGSVPIVWLSRPALRDPASHGFYRFLAFEAILGLLALNGPYWLTERFAPRQQLSWGLLFIALYLVLHGLWLLQRHGNAGPERADERLLAFEKTRELVICGIYRWIRHPMYASLIFFTWGVLLKQPTPMAALLASCATACMVATARVEERECLDYFGTAYAEYMGKTWRFVPGIY